MTTINRTRTESGTVSIPRGTVHLSSDLADTMVSQREGRREITDACAAAIAAAWQSPTGSGRHFAALIGHFPVPVSDLLDAISDALGEVKVMSYSEREPNTRALGMLATWAVNGPDVWSDETAHVNYPHWPGALYDCAACEARCHCLAGESECVFSGEHEPLI